MVSQYFFNFLSVFSAWMQIFALTLVVYYLSVLLRSTRIARMLLRVIFGVVLFMVLVYLFRLDVLYHLFETISTYIIILVVVIFQPEIRRAFTMMSSRWMKLGMRAASSDNSGYSEVLVQIVAVLAQRRCGALIAIEQKVSLLVFQDLGVAMDASLTPELLWTIFYSGTPLHDGGVVIRNGRVTAARCVFPLAQESPELEHLGTRHRAAVGLSEETDAIILVVSEQTGQISIAHNGHLFRNFNGDRLLRYLNALFSREQQESAQWSEKFAQLFSWRVFNPIKRLRQKGDAP